MYKTYKNLTIRNATVEDALLLSAWWNDGSIMEHAGYHMGTGETPDMIAEKIRKDSDTTYRRLIIEEESPMYRCPKLLTMAPTSPIVHGHIPIGEMSFRNVGHFTAEIGIKICNVSRQNMGYGHIVLSMLLEELFDVLHYETVILDTNVENKCSRRVYESLGFQQVGVQEHSFRNSRDQWVTSVHYKLTPDNFHSYLN
jgi:RimJ/RimL family protein N-acetyltransferase